MIVKEVRICHFGIGLFWVEGNWDSAEAEEAFLEVPLSN